MTPLSRIGACAALLLALAVLASGANLVISPPTGTTLNATTGTFYSSTFTTSGGVGQLTWGQQGLPASLGLNLNPSTGVLSGTPPPGSAGKYVFTVAVHDSAPAQNSGSADYILSISAPPPLTLTTMSVPSGTAGTTYPTFAFGAMGGNPPYTFSNAGALPMGMNFNAAGMLSGTPSPISAGSYPMNVKVTDSQGMMATGQYTLIINPPTLSITTMTVPPGTAGSGYPAVTIMATGGTPPYTFSETGSLPAGITLSASGVLSGMLAANSAGSYTFLVIVTDSQQVKANRQFTLTINPSTLVFITTLLQGGEVGANFSQPIQVAGGVPLYTYGIAFGSTITPGLAISASGTITGIPTVAGTFTFTVVVSDSGGAQATHVYSHTIAPPLTNTTLSLTGGTAGSSYGQIIVPSGGVPPYNFILVSITAPGLTLNPSTGVLGGTLPAPGTYTVVVQIGDSLGVTTPPRQYTLTVNAAGAVLQLSTRTLSFTSAGGVDLPPDEPVVITSTSGNPVPYFLQIDNGTTNGAAPSWLKLRRMSGATPDLLVVGIDPNAPPQPLGSQTARIRTLVTGDNTQLPLDITVSYAVMAAAPHLAVLPGFLRFAARLLAPGTMEQTLALQFLGGTGTLGYSASSDNPSAVSVSPASGQIVPNSPAFVVVRVNTAGFGAGPRRFVVRITTPLGSIDVPVLVFVSDAGPILALSQTGLLLEEGANGTPLAPQIVQVFNFGDPGTVINWSARVLRGANAVSLLSGSSGTATTSQLGAAILAANSNVPDGSTALVEFSAPNALNSPQYLVAVVRRAAASSRPGLWLFPPGAVLFPGGARQTVRVYTDSPTPVSFQAGTDAPGVISFAPSSGTVSAASPAQIVVSANGSGAASLFVAIGGELKIVNVTSIVPALAPAPTSEIRAVGCSASRLSLTHAGMPNNFSVPAGWPATLIVQLSDDCGAPVLNGSVVANFSNNDAPLSLVGDRLTGTYSATWQPGRVAAPMTVTAFATAGALAPASAQLIGGVNPNQFPTPVLFKNGVGNNSYPVVGAALAPGTVSLVFGSGLASQTVSPGVVPLVTNFNGTDMLVGGVDAPLYYLSDGQLDIEIPFELTPNRQYQAIVAVNGALTLPETIDLAPVSPGVTAFPDGQLIAQHPDYTLVDTGHPAKPAEYLTMYLAGMGATNPGVASAQPAPGGPFATAAVQPTVTVDGQDAAISFAGLTPGGVGLYQINFQVPPTARAGTLEVVVMQGTVAANTTRMPVAP